MQIRERFESWIQDARYAARGLARDPLLAGFVVLTLSLGIGMNVTSFSLVDRLLLRDPSHVADPGGLVRLYGTVVQQNVGDRTSSWIPWPVYVAMRDEATVFAEVAAFRVQPRLVGAGVAARTVRVAQTIDGFFAMVGVSAQRGRLWTEGDNAAAGHVAVIGHRYWETAFDGDPGVLGATLAIDGVEHTIIGIAPAGFSGLETRRVDVWMPGDRSQAGSTNWQIIGRVRPGVSAEAVTAEPRAIFRRTSEAAPRWFQEATLFAGSIRSDETGREPFEATMARWLSGVSAVILLVALANVVSLLLVRLARRRRELAIRVALGSGRARVMRLLALEGVLLAFASGIASLFVARVSEPLVRRALFADEASWTFSVADVRYLGVALLVVVATALITGLAPAMQAMGSGLSHALRAGAQGGGSGNARVRAVLTVVQAALSVMLLVGAGLFLRSLARIDALDMGVDRDEVIAATAHLPPPARFTSDYFDRAREQELDVYRRLAPAVSRMPGVQIASVAVGLPLDGGWFSAAVFVEGMDSVPSLPGGGPWASVVGPGYFETAGTSVLRGRAFTELDREGSELVLIIGQTMSERLWPDGDAMDACVRISRSDSQCYRVVGIVENVHRVGLREQPSLQYYVPLGQQSMFSGATLLVRPSPGTQLSWPELQRAMLAVDPAIRGVEMRWLGEALDGEMRPLRLGMVTFGLSGALALVVVIIGLYGLMSYMVAWRTREIGVRMAIGATGTRIVRMVIASGAGLAGLGVAIGLMVSFWASRWVEPHLFETRGADPLVFAGVGLALIAVAVVAGWLPARRALSISPTEALRAE
jgi:predicted permease